jgi:histidinol-phosphatase (PHP family)
MAAVIASYHNHTVWSDGRATVARTLEAAARQGLDEVGISDHWVLDPGGQVPSWSMDPDRLGEYVAEVKAVTDGSKPVLRLGLEVDWFPGHGDAIGAWLGRYEFDYLIGSVHTVDGFRADSYAGLWDALEVGERNEIHRRYWLAIEDLARSGLFDIVAHLDLTKKFNQQPTVDLSNEIDAALHAIAEAGMAVELNTSGWSLPCADAYPSIELLRACRARGIPALVNADAHRPEDLTWSFERGRARLREAGYEEVAIFEGRRRKSVPLPAD